MARMAEEMLRDIDKDTVDWDANFDETRQEPRVLPSRFPNLLVNGSNGIAVGMATNIPPHNLTEVINACICVLKNPDATLDDLLGCVSGPDFPTRGIIMGKSGIRQAYATGRGKIIIRARTEFEEYGKDKRTRIIVTELPYQVNKRMLIASIADLVKEKRLEGLSDLRDESDRNGMRIVIELKRDAVPQVVLNHLLTMTQLQTSFSINMLALVDNQTQPKILSCATYWMRISPIRKRSSSAGRNMISARRRSVPICWKGSSSRRTISTRSSTSSAAATTTPSRTSWRVLVWMTCRPRPSAICA